MSGLVVVPTGNTAWAGLAGLTKPSFSQSSKTPAPPLALFPSPFISVFHSPFCVHVLILLFWGTGLSSHSIPRVVGGLLKKHKGMVLGMGLLDAEFRITVLAAFSLALSLYRVCLFSRVFWEVPSVRLSSAMSSCPFLGFH